MDSTTRQQDQPATSSPSSNRVVLFADMLGFAALTEANPVDLRMLQAHSRLPDSFEALDERINHNNPLTTAFTRFHYALKWAIMTAEMTHPLTAIAFSDSVFIATNYLFEAATFAVNFARSMLSNQIPVRMGIAFGSFAALRFRSDVTADSGDHAAQFLGTAVVRAHQAEQCGIKGMRILLHPSVKDLLHESVHCPSPPPVNTISLRPIECSRAERENANNKLGVCYELDYWDLAKTKEREAWHKFQDMWTVAPDAVHAHYQATAEAIGRMRVAQGEAPLTSLRRRTLPRSGN
jgi:uncharacterized protein YecT (DUF1311 family)